MEKEDVHFLIDSAPPIEVEYLLQCLELNVAYSTEDLRERLLSVWSYQAQKHLTNSTRRLFDLKLSDSATTVAGKPGHTLTRLGARVQAIRSIDHVLYKEVMHFLHYTGYDASPSARKLFWSYQICCEIVWMRKYVPPTPELVAEVQSRIAESYPSAYASRLGGNFNAGGVTSGWKPWLAQLEPSPFLADGNLVLRQSDCFELVLLALDHVYRSRGYRYGDPTILDDTLLDEMSRVFLLDPICCRQLVDRAARLTKSIKLSDTFVGTSITLLAPYGIERI